jgi:leader peptidase (prepilin peptidase)/N-methyltransferase
VLVAACAALLGLVVGSFLNVVIYRLPVMLDREWRRGALEALGLDAPPKDDADGRARERLGLASSVSGDEAPFDLARPRSACPSCRTQIRAIHNVPVLSWLALRGRCAHCGAAIPVRYPLVEAFTAVVSVLVALRFGPTLEGAGYLLLAWSLIALAGIDVDHQLLPDAITLPLVWLGLAFAIAGERVGGFVLAPDLESAVIGAIAGYGSLWAVYQLFRLATGKEGMGYGDFKLLAALGAWLGWQVLHVIIVLSSLVGAVVGIAMIVALGRNRQLPIPFGPYLAAAGLATLLWGAQACRATLLLCPVGGP